ncbi:hypothetical protein D3C78_1892060 [compost metagenome]
MPWCNCTTPRRTSSAHSSPISGKLKPRVSSTSLAWSGSMRVIQFCRKMRAGKVFSMSAERNALRMLRAICCT